jgi:hypothetical protein
MEQPMSRRQLLRQSAAAGAALWLSVRGVARPVAFLIAFGVVGYAGGGALAFTPLQRATFCFACLLLASWVMGVLRGDPLPVVGIPVVGVLLTAAFGLLLDLSFVGALTGAVFEDLALEPSGIEHPRFISMIVTTLPVVPYAVSSIGGLLWRG